jgi:hypothetical protein
MSSRTSTEYKYGKEHYLIPKGHQVETPRVFVTFKSFNIVTARCFVSSNGTASHSSAVTVAELGGCRCHIRVGAPASAIVTKAIMVDAK